MRISDWSSDVCSSDLTAARHAPPAAPAALRRAARSVRAFEQAFEFGRFLGFEMVERSAGRCTMVMEVDRERHFNPHGVAHGGVAFSLADTAMGGALHRLLAEGQWCAPLEDRESVVEGKSVYESLDLGGRRLI